MGSGQLVVFGFVLVCVGLSEARFLDVKMQPRWEVKDQKLSWKFPEDPVDPVKRLPVQFEQQRPERRNRVGVRCGESRIQVEVSQDLLGIGKLMKPEEVTLGGCSATEVDDSAHVLAFESELHDCGSRLVMTGNAVIYAFTLEYNPKVSGRSNIIRSQRAIIGVECHYPIGLDPDQPAKTHLV